MLAVGCVVAPELAIAASVPRKSSPESGLSDPAFRGEFSGLSATGALIFISVSDARAFRTSCPNASKASLQDQLRVQLPRLVQFLDDRDPVVCRHLELIQDAHQVLQLRPARPR